MMLVEGPRWLAFGRDVVPDKHHNLADRLSKDMYKVIRGYVNGQVILATLASLLIMPAVLALHIGYAAGLMVVIFTCGLIPMIGHSIGAVIVTIVALFHSTTAAVIILAYYMLYIQIENYIIQPKIQSNTTNMSPLLVFISLVIGLSFGGIIGGLVAIPVGGCIRIAILEYLYSRDIIDAPEFRAVTTLETK
jgi:predicted PurR-regulated permease PerM